MNDFILAKMRDGDWGEVVRLMREATIMHGKSASFVKGNGFRLLPNDGGVGSVNYGFLPATATNPLRGGDGS